MAIAACFATCLLFPMRNINLFSGESYFKLVKIHFLIFQETLACGQATYSVNFEPTRPMLTNGVPTKYTFQPLTLLIGSETNICNMSANSSPSPIYDPKITAMMNALETRLVITYCENCSKCMDQLVQIHRIITRTAGNKANESRNISD